METTFIYALIDPRDNQVRYIGKSNKPGQRLIDHLSESRICKKHGSLKVNWIKSLLKLNLKPELLIIDEISFDEWQFWEQYYISLYKSWGFVLKNGDNGGLGSGRVSENVRRKISKTLKGNIPWNKGKNHSLERRQQQVDTNPNKKPIIQLHKDSLQIVNVYESLAAVEFHTKIPYTQISLVLNKENRTCRNYKWVTVENCEILKSHEILKKQITLP